MSKTIVAISTAPGVGGIGIVRMSGNDCFDILSKIFVPINDSEIKGYSIKYGKIVDEDEIVDEVLVSYFVAPKSYTTENMVEINSHGGISTTNKILDDINKILTDINEILAQIHNDLKSQNNPGIKNQNNVKENNKTSVASKMIKPIKTNSDK